MDLIHEFTSTGKKELYLYVVIIIHILFCWFCCPDWFFSPLRGTKNQQIHRQQNQRNCPLQVSASSLYWLSHGVKPHFKKITPSILSDKFKKKNNLDLFKFYGIIRLEIACSRPCLDSCVCDVSHSTEDWKTYTLAKNQERFLKPAKKPKASNVSGERDWEIFTVTKG